ncbi:MAG: hypothetical protein ACK559_23385, partial [bacterium]
MGTVGVDAHREHGLAYGSAVETSRTALLSRNAATVVCVQDGCAGLRLAHGRVASEGRSIYRLDFATRSISSFFLIAYEFDEP